MSSVANKQAYRDFCERSNASAAGAAGEFFADDALIEVVHPFNTIIFYVRQNR